MMEVTCLNCGWVNAGVTRAHAEAEVSKFNDYFDTLSAEDQQEYYGGKRSTIEQYEGCFFCKGTTFRPSEPGDCPDGCTIQPAIYEETG